jgi:hypothetical protein
MLFLILITLPFAADVSEGDQPVTLPPRMARVPVDGSRIRQHARSDARVP